MNCSRCRAANDPAYRFCARCGLPLKAEADGIADGTEVREGGNEGVPTPATGAERGTRLALAAVAAGALLLVGSAVGFQMTRARRVAPRPAASQPAGTQQAADAATAPAAGAPAGPQSGAPAAFAMPPSLTAPAAMPPAGATSPATVANPRPAAPLPPLQQAEPGGLIPAIVRRVEPGGPAPAEPQPGEGRREASGGGVAPAAPSAVEPAAPRAEKPRRVEVGGAEDSLISIEVREDGESGGGGAGRVPTTAGAGSGGAGERGRTGPGEVEVRIEPGPAGWSPGEEAARQLTAARNALREGRAGEAREAYAEAARLYRLLLNRGGSEAVNARRGLAEAERSLRGGGGAGPR